MGRFAIIWGLCLIALNPLFAGGLPPSGLQILKAPVPPMERHDPHLTYDFDLQKEQFFIWAPKDYADGQKYGLLVFMSPMDGFVDLPAGWDRVLEESKMIFVAPQRVGNNQDFARRAGLGVVAAKEIEGMVSLDPKRIYIGGLSGGGRVASYVAFCHPELFRGVLGNCGMNFPGRVERIKATEPDDYGVFEMDQARKEIAKQQTRFVIVTGAKDFRYGNLLDIYHGGYEKNGYTIKFMDVPGMGHDLCGAAELKEALDFLDTPLVP